MAKKSVRLHRLHIPKVYVGQQMVTRSKTKLFRKFGIKGLHVRLDVNFQAVVMNWLAKTNNARIVDPVVGQAHQDQMPEPQLEQPSQPSKLPARLIQRRGSVAGGSLFNVNNHIRETGSDFLRKINSQPPNNHVVGQNHRENNEPAMEQEVENIHHEMNIDIENSDTITTCQQASENAPSSAPFANGVQKPSGKEENRAPDNFAKEVLKVSSQFNPFLRLPNPPFTLNGRMRSQSMECVSMYRRPSLPTIFEDNENASGANQNDVKDPFILNPVGPFEPNIVSENDTTFATTEDFAMEVHEAVTDTIEGSNDGIKEEYPAVNAIISKWVNRFNTYSL